MATVLVTGANRGIGLSLCKVFLAEGNDIVAVCRQPSPELSQLGAKVEVVSDVDVTQPKAVSALKQRLGKKRIDILVNNAGVLRDDRLTRLDLDLVEEQIRVNAIAPLRVVHALLENLGMGSKVALITSRMGSIGDNTSGGYYGYRMSKAALNAAGMSLARDLASRQVAVALLHPGYVRTDMTSQSGNVAPEDAAAQLATRIRELTMKTSGTFWHANGDILPW